MRIILALAIFLPTLSAQPVLRLKSGREPAPLATGPASGRTSKPDGRAALISVARHFIVQFESQPDAGQLQALRDRGLTVVEAVPDFGYIVFGFPDTNLNGLDVFRVVLLEPGDKLSTTFSGDDSLSAIVERHADVGADQVRLAALEEGLLLIDHPDLAPRHILVQGSRNALERLAARDEVSCIFPASADLIAGEPAAACPLNGLSIGELSGVSNLASSFGDGWDGPGLGAAKLTYAFGFLTPVLPATSLRAEFERAMAQWSATVRVDFQRTTTSGLARSIDIFFAARNHGDGYPFDGPGRTLAHTFYPPPNSEPLAGDLHLDLDESWRIGADYDLFSVVLHELGHALGLGHNDDPTAVMYAYYRRYAALGQPDIAAIRRLYASRDAATPPVTPPANPPSTPATSPTTPPATPPPTPSPKTDTTAPTITITAPSSSMSDTTAATCTVRGTARDNVEVASVVWSASSGDAGGCSGTTTWSTPPIALRLGTNFISIKASDEAGNSSTRTVTIVRR